MSGFSTEEFLNFSTIKIDNILHTAVSKTAFGEEYPVLVVNKNDRNFLITPICLSGPSSFDERTDFKILLDQFEKFNICGGFLQTRHSIEESEEFGRVENVEFFKDYRTNFRFNFDEVNVLLQKMHKSSKRYSKKILADAENYTLKKIAHDDLDSIELFSKMYHNTSVRLEFSESYKFELQSWISLLSSKISELYLLYYKDRLVSGTVINPVKGGFDYTFVTHDLEFKNSGRANVLFLAKYLNQNSEGKYMDLGGGMIEGDSLSRFKKELGCTSEFFKRIRFVVPKNYGGKNFETNLLKGYWPQ